MLAMKPWTCPRATVLTVQRVTRLNSLLSFQNKHVYSTTSTPDSGYKFFRDLVQQNTTDGPRSPGDQNAGRVKHTNTESSIVDESFIGRETKPVLRPSHNLAAYVNQSELLKNLVKLGVDLSKVESKQDVSWLIKLDFDENVKPYLNFFRSVGMQGSDVGWYLTKNINILNESLEDLEVRVNYFRSKKFEPDAIARIVTKSPELLCCDVKSIDDRLGFLQKDFKLTGDELRLVVTRQPKLIMWRLNFIKDVKFHMDKFMGFKDIEIRQLMIALPKLFLTAHQTLIQRFDYVHNVMEIPHGQIVLWPNVLRTRRSTIKTRHQYLVSIGRDQFDPKLENYVSLKALVSGRDREFCENVAKRSINEYNDFLKTL